MSHSVRLPADRTPLQAVVQFLELVHGDEPAGSLLELRWRTGSGPVRQEFIALRDPVRAARRVLRLQERADVYFGVNPRARRDGTARGVDRCWALYVDADTPEALSAIEGYRPGPSIVVRTGPTSGHAYWSLSAPLLPGELPRANRRLAHHLGGDLKSVDVARVLRPPGTLNHKPGRRCPVDLVHFAPVRHRVSEIVGHLPDPPSSRRPLPAQSRPQGRHDALRDIPSSIYVPALTGREAGRDGKVRCPFHAAGAERTPSLQTWDDPERGWWCFGCDGGTTIVDFAARLYSIEPRGRGFHELRRRLAADLLPHLVGVAG